MRIGFDAKRAFLNSSGLGNYSRHVITGMSSIYPGSEYLLYTPATGLFTPPENTSVVLPESKIATHFPSAWRSFWLNGQLNRDGIDLFHGLSNEIPHRSAKSRYRTCVTIHDLIFLRLPSLYPATDRFFYKKKTSYAVKNADRIISTSEQTRKDLVELLDADPERITVIYQDCNPGFYQPASIEEKERVRIKYNLPDSYILYVGTIEERKNLLRVAEALHLSDLNIPVIAAGRRTAYAAKVERYISEKKIRNFRLIGETESRDLPAMYQMANLFIYPSIYEGFGIPVLEALNSGTPVITSAGGCLEESGGDGALLVNPLKSEEIAEAIKTVLKNTSLRDSMIEKGLRHAKKFRQQETIPLLYKVYESCLK